MTHTYEASYQLIIPEAVPLVLICAAKEGVQGCLRGEYSSTSEELVTILGQWQTEAYYKARPLNSQKGRSRNSPSVELRSA